MTAVELKVQDLYSAVPEKGLEQVRRHLPKNAVATYLGSIRAAYDAAGLKPACNGSHPARPGLVDETGLFQVGLTEYQRTGYAVGRFVASSFGGVFAAEHAISAQNGEFTASVGEVSQVIGGGRPFELTRGQSGTLALVSAFIMSKAEAGWFVPVQAQPTRISVL